MEVGLPRSTVAEDLLTKVRLTLPLMEPPLTKLRPKAVAPTTPLTTPVANPVTAPLTVLLKPRPAEEAVEVCYAKILRAGIQTGRPERNALAVVFGRLIVPTLADPLEPRLSRLYLLSFAFFSGVGETGRYCHRCGATRSGTEL